MFSIQQFYRTDIKILKDLGFRVHLSNNFFDFFLFWKYDITFIYFYRIGLIPAIISKLFFKKVIFTGGIDFLDKQYAGLKNFYIQKLFFIFCSSVSDKNILVSHSDIHNIKSFKKKLPEKRFPLSYHVINFQDYKYDGQTKGKVICTICWMLNEENVLRKGVDKPICLFKEIFQIDNEFRMIIIGSIGHGTELLKAIIEKENLTNYIIFTGTISENEKIDILNKSSLYTQLSEYEGFGIAAIEALASGNIVVHSGKGGLKDGISSYGILMENNDFKSMARNIYNLLSNPSQRNEIIRNGIQHVAENFAYEKRLDDFRCIFNSFDKKK
jgi:glycosyltransferase involved in cell wall biosynthesis